MRRKNYSRKRVRRKIRYGKCEEKSIGELNERIKFCVLYHFRHLLNEPYAWLIPRYENKIDKM